MKKVLFMFVAVLALASCQKAAEKSSEAAPADSAAQTEAVPQDGPKAAELKAPVKTGDAVADAKAMAEYIKAKVKTVKSLQEFEALNQDPVFAEFDKLCENASPEIQKIAEEIEPVIEEQMKALLAK